MEWCLWEQLYNFPNCVFLDSLNNSNSFQSKMLYIVLVFKWSCLDTLLSILNLCSCHKLFNRTQTFGKVSCIQKIPEKAAQVRFLRYEISLPTLQRVVKWAKDILADKSASSGTSILVAFNSEIWKENKLSCRNVWIYFTTRKPVGFMQSWNCTSHFFPNLMRTP